MKRFLLLTLLLPIFSADLFAQPSLQWARQLGGGPGEANYGIATDAAGNVYTTGYFIGTADFDPGPATFNLSSANGGIFISKLNSLGQFVWAKNWGGTFNDISSDIAIDAAGNIYTTGEFTSPTADFDPGPGVFNLTTANASAFISKLNAAGDFQWAIKLESNITVRSFGISLDASGDPHITGHFFGTTDFDPGAGVVNRTTVGSGDMFVAKYTSAGVLAWVSAMGGAGNDAPREIAVDNSGSVYTTGVFSADMDFDPGVGVQMLIAGGEDVFISKLSSTGSYVWAKRLGSAGHGDIGESIAVDAAGNVYTTGYFRDLVDFDPNAGVANLSSAGGDDVFVSKLTSAGVYVWARSMGGASSEQGFDITVDGTGNVYTTGLIGSGTADFDPGVGTYNLTTGGSGDIFVSKLDAAGNFVWAGAMGGPSTGDFGRAISVSGLDVYVSGNFVGTADLDPGIPVSNLTASGSGDVFVIKLGTIIVPLSLLDFTASPKGNTAQLSWATASEQNTAAFVIEHSADGRNFSAIGTVATKGNSQVASNYAYFDKKPLGGTNYYRLKMIDTDGRFTHSPVRSVTFEKTSTPISVYPNPANDVINISSAVHVSEKTIWTISDGSGRKIMEKKGTGLSRFQWDIASLRPGTYVLLAITGAETSQVRFVKL